ncbi:PREDICTED: H/ACA ribonucleoprotein complex non-core subunit NAF1, partial [Gavialis gangeticus]|uniref:H/ACA ribonucleoprotein complex non-core subunit NAF1 n=1 Tax=Gavialis gangeticus TaxID=94835 RepID=UPI00092E8547
MEVATQLETLTFDHAPPPGPGPDSEPTAQPGQAPPCAGAEAPAGDSGQPCFTSDSSLDSDSSDSDSDTDTESSSSVLSSSSCPLIISDDDSQKNGKDNKPSSVEIKDELPVEELPLGEDLVIILPEDIELKPFGRISSIIDQLVVIESLKGLPPVNEESIIFKEDRHAAGKIFEIFGPVSRPFYVLRFNSPEHIKKKGINLKDAVYFAPSVEDFTQYIFAEKLQQEKGSDASWLHDQEPPPEALDFSDDEKEREAKQKKKKPQNQGRKKSRSDMNESSEKNGVQCPPAEQPTSSYSRLYCGREFSRGRGPRLFHPPHFLRPQLRPPQVRPPQLYSPDHRMHQKSAVCPQATAQDMIQHYPFLLPPPPPPSTSTPTPTATPPPVFGPVHNGICPFPPPPPPPPGTTDMVWTGMPMNFNMYGLPFP